MKRFKPTLTLVYLPHLDYDLQRFGPESAVVPHRLREVDRCVGAVVEAAREIGARVVVVSEYGLTPVRRPVLLNQALRRAGWLTVRNGPFGEMLDPANSAAFAVCDHQVAHVYVADVSTLPSVSDHVRQIPGVTDVLDREAQREFQLQHARSGDLVVLADPDAWFAYPYWIDDALAPDFARTVDIHRKPGYDPCELFVDPSLRHAKLRMLWRVFQKKLGFRYRMDVVPLDTGLVRGSHGLPPADPTDGPMIAADSRDCGPLPTAMSGLKGWLLETMGFV
jgi:predicted AlkP superfamily pyrophosphatase or phosphodiesterase